MRTRPVVVLLLALSSLAACGGGGDDEATTTTTAGATTSTAATSEAADQAKLQEIVLKDTDFPPGWTATPHDASDDEASEREMEQCLGAEPTDPNRPSATSPDFQMGEFSQVMSSAEMTASAEAVGREFQALRSPKFNDCAKQLIDKEIKAEAGEVEFAPSTVQSLTFPKLGDDSFAVRITTAVVTQDQRVPIYSDVVFIKKGRVGMSLNFFSAGEPFPASLATDLARKMVARA